MRKCSWDTISLSGECQPAFNLWYDAGVWYHLDISHVLLALQIAPGETFLDRPGQRERWWCCNGTLKPLIPLLMHGYKYSTSKNLSCCLLQSAQRQAVNDGHILLIQAMEKQRTPSNDPMWTRTVFVSSLKQFYSVLGVGVPLGANHTCFYDYELIMEVVSTILIMTNWV